MTISLTPHERSLMTLIANGCSNREAGERLGLTRHVVAEHLKTIRHRLGARDRAHAVGLCLRYRLIDPDGVRPGTGGVRLAHRSREAA